MSDEDAGTIPARIRPENWTTVTVTDLILFFLKATIAVSLIALCAASVIFIVEAVSNSMVTR